MINKKASVLIYAIVLTTISLLLASVLLHSNSTLISTQKYYKINTQFFNQIKSNNTLNFDYLQKLNSDGSGFLDNYSGSGADIKCRIQGDGTYFVEGNSGSISGSDGRDDNCDDDNYLATSSGNLIEDNDNKARKELIGIVLPEQMKNIFWNNKKIEEFIEGNPNNIDSFNKTLSGVNNGYLYLNVNTESILTLIEYDKARYNNFNELREIKSFTGAVSGSGYIEKNSDILSLNSSTGANTYNFNFSGSGYLLFLTNTGSNLIDYNLSGLEKNTGSGIYLNPINDDINNTGSIEILGYDVLINKEGNIFGKMLKKIFLK